jgi:anthranilate/para-aminobenzoate synthase component II
MKAVAVSQRVDALTDRPETRDSIDQKLMGFLLFSGLLPFPVPNELAQAEPGASAQSDAFDDWVERVKPAAVVLSGGNEVGGCPERDRTERRLLEHARRHRLPLLGICRGMEMMAVWAGGQLKPVTGHVRTRHSLSGKLDWTVNSYHDYALDGCPPGYEVLAQSEDGVIEAMRHNDLPWEGWMWHPEREGKFPSADAERLRRLFA